MSAEAGVGVTAPAGRTRSTPVEAIVVAAAFGALAIVATWPLLAHAANRLPSDAGDPVLNAWILGWDADRLRAGLSHLWDAPNFFPYRGTLAWSENLLGIAVFTAPIQWLTGNAVLAYNVAFIGSWALTAIGMYVLARSLTGSAAAAWFAAAAFAFSPVRMGHLSHLQWLMLGWTPLTMWAVHRFFGEGRLRFAVAAAVCFVLQATTTSYLSYFASVPIACGAAADLWRTRVPPRRLLIAAAVAGAIVAAALGPIAAHYYAARQQQAQHRTLDDITQYSANLADYAKAPPAVRVWRALPAGGSDHERFPGVLPLAFAGVALAAARRRSPWVVASAAAAALAFVLSLGPAPAAGSHQLPIPGPYRLALAVVPGLDGLRAPGRLALMVVLALVVTAAFGGAWLIERVPSRLRPVVAVLLVAGAIAEGWIAPMRLVAFAPTGDARDRAAYDYLRGQPRGGVLELPTSVTDPIREYRYEYLTLVHRHPVVNGHSGYDSPLLDFLGDAGSPFLDFDHLDAAFSMAGAIGIRYVLVHRGEGDGAMLADALGRAAAAHPERVIGTRDFGSSLLITIPYQPLPAPPPATRAIPPASIRASASRNPDRLTFAFDGDPDSRWLSGGPQQGDEWIDLQLDRDRDIASVRLVLSERSFGNYPRRLAVDVVEDGRTRTVYDGTVLPQFAAGLIARGTTAPIDVILPPNHANSLRLRQTGTSHAFFWSVDELELFER